MTTANALYQFDKTRRYELPLRKKRENVSGACKCANFKKLDIGTGNLLFVITKYGGVKEDEQYFEPV